MTYRNRMHPTIIKFRINVNDTMVGQVNKLIIWESKQIQKQNSIKRLTENTEQFYILQNYIRNIMDESYYKTMQTIYISLSYFSIVLIPCFTIFQDMNAFSSFGKRGCTFITILSKIIREIGQKSLFFSHIETVHTSNNVFLFSPFHKKCGDTTFMN
jgi:hypothetical protein